MGRENQISIEERENYWLTLVLATKIVDLDANIFHFLRVLMGCCLTLILLEMVDLSS